MSDNGLPKATMANFIKQHISDKRKVSAEFTSLLLDLSKQFIDKVSAKANQICESQNKKTINNDHFFNALRELQMGDIIGKLQKIDQTIKLKQKKKQQQKQKVQENVRILNKRRQSQMQDEKKKQKAPIIQHSSKYKPIQLNDDQQDDYVEILEQDDLQMQDENEQQQQMGNKTKV